MLDKMLKRKEPPEEQQIVAANDEEVGTVIKNGSKDKWGKLRANVGGRPSKHSICLRGVQGPGAKSNRLQPGEKPLRFELPGPVQVEIAQHLTKTAAKFAATEASKQAFWKEVRPEFKDLPQRRLKQIMVTQTSLKPE